MSKRITAVALAVLMLALALPANAAIQATSVEVRGAIAEPSTSAHAGELVSDVNAAWNPYNFAGFYYDLKNDLGNENLAITKGSLTAGSRTIPLNDLTYTTSGQPKVLYLVQNGKSDGSNGGPLSNGLQDFGSGQMSGVQGAYNVVGWQAQAYVGIKNHSYKLTKLIIEQQNASSDKKTMTVGDTWDIGGGWTLTANSIDAKASPRQVWLTLSKDGVKKDDNVVQQGAVYTYVEKNIGGESDVPLFVTYVDSVFSGATSDVVQFRYTWAIDTSVTELKGGDTYGVFKVMSTEPVELQNNDNTVTLSRDTYVSLMGNMDFHVADSDTVRFYPAAIRTDPGTYEVRGSTAEPSTSAHAGELASDVNAAWNPYNFAGFYYDLKNDLGNEQLAITPGSITAGSRTISLDNLIYTTSGQPKVLYAVQNGKSDGSSGGPLSNGLQNFGSGQMSAVQGAYNVVGWQAQAYVGIKNHSYKLAKLIIEQQNASSDKKTMTVGDTWDIGGGWTLTANSIDAKASPRQVWLTLSKDGVKKDDNVVPQGQVYTYVEKNIGGESDVPLFVTYVDSVFSGATSDVVQFRYTWAIDTSVTELKGGDTYGVFKVMSTEPIQLKNDDNTVTLSRDTHVSLMGEMEFHVADSDTVRFYPDVQYQIGGPSVTPTPTPSITGTATVTGTATGTATVTGTATGTATVTGTATGTAATPTAAATTKPTPGFEAVFAIAGLLAVAYLVLRQRK